MCPSRRASITIERGKRRWRINQSYPDYIDLRDRNRSFDGLAPITITQAGLDTGNNPLAAWVDEASGNYFDVWVFSRISAVSFMARTSMARTALRISCSATLIGRAIFRVTAACGPDCSS